MPRAPGAHPTMVKSLSFIEVLTATARQKAEAAKARSHPDPAATKPKDVISNACAEIADRLTEHGFTFLKSGPGLKRVQGDVTHEIAFQSDRNNIAGRRAAVWIHAGVSSRRLGQWRSTHPNDWVRREGPYSGRIVGGQIGNLTTPHGWMEWDFADQAKRQGLINDAVAAIRRIVLPFFALFEDPGRSIETLIQYDLMWQVSLLEYALASLGTEAAETFGRSLLRRKPEVQELFEAAYAEFAKTAPPRARGQLGRDLAALAVATDLDLLGCD